MAQLTWYAGYRQRFIASAALLASLSLGLVVGVGQASATEETNDCTGTPASPVVLPTSGSYSDTSWSSSAVRWTYTTCDTCDVSETDPQEHETHIELSTTHLPNCAGYPDHYVATITVTFCSPMSGGSALQILGDVPFHQGNNTCYRPLYYLTSTTATATLPCPLGLGDDDLRSYPDQIDIKWGVNYASQPPSDTPAKGKAFKGFDVLVTCCNL